MLAALVVLAACGPAPAPSDSPARLDPLPAGVEGSWIRDTDGARPATVSVGSAGLSGSDGVCGHAVVFASLACAGDACEWVGSAGDRGTFTRVAEGALVVRSTADGCAADLLSGAFRRAAPR